GGRPGWACPDFLIEESDGSLTVIEVKRALYQPAGSTLTRLEAVRRSCEQLQLGFKLITGLNSREQAVFDLLHAFHSERCLLGAGIEELKEQICEAAAERTAALEDLWAIGSERQTKPLVWWMLWHNILCFDWS